MTKTNAMRLLENAGIPFETGEYEVDESDLSGTHAAAVLGLDPDCMFKTLVCRDDRGGYQVFCIPVAYELDLKKCAAAAEVKRCEMIHVKELLPRGHEEEVPHLHRRDRPALRQDLRQRRHAGRPAHRESGTALRLCGGPLCRSDPVTVREYMILFST